MKDYDEQRSHSSSNIPYFSIRSEPQPQQLQQQEVNKNQGRERRTHMNNKEAEYH
jgi:hypothetical protein